MVVCQGGGPTLGCVHCESLNLLVEVAASFNAFGVSAECTRLMIHVADRGSLVWFDGRWAATDVNGVLLTR